MNIDNSLNQKQKLISNLDKICFDPIGHLANAELLKSDQVVLLYNKGICGSDKSEWKTFEPKIYKVEIEGEIIDLNQASTNWFEEIRTALVEEIKANKNDWKIAGAVQGSDSGPLIQHKSGRRHWKSLALLSQLTEIEALLGNNDFPNKPELPQKKEQDKQDNSEKLKKEKELQEIKKQLTEVREKLNETLARVKKLEGEKNKETTKKLTQIKKKNEELAKTMEIGSLSEIKEQISKSQKLLKEVPDNTKQEVGDNKENKEKYMKYGLYGVGGIVLIIGFVAIYKLIKKSKH